MALVTIQQGTSDWGDIRDAAQVIWRASTNPSINALRDILQDYFSDPALTTVGLNAGINSPRRAVVVCTGVRITIAFGGSHPDELLKNTWANGTGPNWWNLPFPVYIDGHRVHSFFRDIWHGMREAAFATLVHSIESVLARGETPKQIIVTGFSMGGGISILAFMDLLEFVRSTYGSTSSLPQSWAVDSDLGSLTQHLTFAAVAAADQGYYTVLNKMYERYKIRAWDFVNHKDWTVQTHFFAFRSWRGHRYILQDAIVGQYSTEFGPQGHFILGYLKAAEWMAVNGTNQVQSVYSY